MCIGVGSVEYFLYKKLIKFSLPLLGLLFAFYILKDAVAGFDFSAVSFSPIFLLVSFLMLLFLFYLDALGWFLINKALGIGGQHQETVFVWIVSSISRYIPGVFWAYSNKYMFLRERSASIALISSSFTLEAFFLAGAALFVGANLLWFDSYQQFFIRHVDEGVLLSILGVVIVLSTCAWIFRVKLKVLLKIFSGEVSLGRIALLFGYYVLLWIFFLIAFSFMAIAFIGQHDDTAILLILGLCFCLAFGLSFILVVFPGGLGIREVILFTLLSLSIDPALAALIAVVSRIWIILGEIVCVSICAVWNGLISRRTPETR